MSYLSSGAQLLGNLEHTAAELLEATMQERGRGFASDNESWAEIKAHLERAKKATATLKRSTRRCGTPSKTRTRTPTGRWRMN